MLERPSRLVQKGNNGLPSVPGLEGEGEVFPLPFDDLPSLTINTLEDDGSLSATVARLLRLEEDEIAKLNQTLDAFRQRVWQHEKESIVPVSIGDEEQIFEIDAVPDLGIKDEMAERFREILGDERADFLRLALFQPEAFGRPVWGIR